MPWGNRIKMGYKKTPHHTTDLLCVSMDTGICGYLPVNKQTSPIAPLALVQKDVSPTNISTDDVDVHRIAVGFQGNQNQSRYL